MNSLSNFIVKARWFIIIGFLLLTVFFARQIPKSEIESSLKEQIPKNMPSRVMSDKIDSLFGGSDMVMILLQTEDILNSETLKRVKKLSRGLERLDGIERVLSLFELKNIKSDQGMMIVDPAVKRIPRSDEQREELRSELKDNDIVYGSVVSEDFSATAVIGMTKTDVNDQELVAGLQELIGDTPGDEELMVTGLPYIRTLVSKDIQGDMRRLMPIGLLIMLIFLFISFRQLRGVLLPFIVVIMTIIFAMGLIPLIGWKIQVITILVPMMMIAIANDYGIHLIARYQELNSPDTEDDNKSLAASIFESLAKPIVLTGLTTIAGMLCLLSHVVIPAKEVGMLSAIGIGYALFASLMFIPAVLAVLKRAKPMKILSSDEGKKHFLERVLHYFGNLVSGYPKTVLTVAILFTLLSSIGIFFVRIDTNPTNYYASDSEVVVATEVANDKFGGSTNVSVVVSGDIKDPEIMNKIDWMENKLRDHDDVGMTSSIARAVKQMSRALNDEGESYYDKIPDTRNAVAQYFELYSMSGDPDDFEKLVDFPYENAQIIARINDISTTKINKVVEYAREITRDDPDFKMVAGFATILGELAELIVKGQVISLITAILIVAIMISIVFRSITAGLISSIPLGLSIVVLFGLMGAADIPLNIATAMLSSIMIGVGIDYTIHFLWRYREERRNGLEIEQAVKHTLTTTGRGIIFNALSVIVGFAVLMVSNFMPVQFFGFLVVVSISACLLGALILIPALCIIIKPKFLEPV